MALARTPALWLAAILVGTSVGISGADEAANRRLFQELDQNQDGQIARQEVDESKRRLFERLVRQADKDADGKLSNDEFVAGLNTAEPGEATPAPAKKEAGKPSDRLAKARQRLERFRQFDANGDGKVALDEVPAQGRPLFERLLDQLDEDNDEALSLAEMGQAARDAADRARQRMPNVNTGTAGPLVRILDRDADGTLSAAEIAQAADSLKRLDGDGDGTLSAAELLPSAVEDARSSGKGEPAKPADKGRQRLARLFERDQNGDGLLSKDEVPPVLSERFDQIDRDGDGQISRAELVQGMMLLRKPAAKNATP